MAISQGDMLVNENKISKFLKSPTNSQADLMESNKENAPCNLEMLDPRSVRLTSACKVLEKNCNLKEKFSEHIVEPTYTFETSNGNGPKQLNLGLICLRRVINKPIRECITTNSINVVLHGGFI